MNYKEWLAWYKSLPLSKRWFIILILARPITDNFYDLKEVSVLTSPLYIIGILTPILIIFSLTSSTLKPSVRSNIDVPFWIWGILVALNCIWMYTISLSVVALGDAIKYLIPLFLFAYCRRFIENKTDLLGICQTFLYASIFPFAMLMYEYLFDPIAIQYMKGRGGGSRLRGGYGDIMNYAIYTIGSLMIIFYYYISKNSSLSYFKDKLQQLKRNRWFYAEPISPIWVVGGIAWGILVMNAIKHVATWGNFLMVVGMLMLFNLRNFRGFFFVIAFSMIFIPFFAEDIYNNMLQPLIEKEINVVEGENEIETLGNGRMTRWEKYFEKWEQMPVINQMIGVSFSGFKDSFVMMGLGMHSDYVRNLFLSGIIGLVFYILFLISMTIKAFSLHNLADKFLVLCCILTIVLYSLTTMPTLYAPYLYLIYCVYAYALLPKEKQF